MSFERDRLERENNDPIEGSSLKFVNVPVILISVFLGFGISYLAMKTPNTSFTPGDSRTTQAAAPAAGAAAQAPQNAAGDLTAVIAKGKQIFTTTCQACHQANGAGIPSAFPPLAGSEWVNGPAERMVAIVLHGAQGEITVKGQKFNGVMPTFGAQLKPEDIAAVATYVRSSFGNQSSAVTPELVKKAQDATKSKSGPWNGESELNSQKWE